MSKLLISHRGNVSGPNPDRENSPAYIQEALDLGYEVEVDVWAFGNELFLGHDAPTYPVTMDFFVPEDGSSKSLWCHAKNLSALAYLLNSGIHCFWHQEDDVTLTSKQYIWTYPGKNLSIYPSVAVMPELFPDWDLTNAWCICSDYVSGYKMSQTQSKRVKR